MFAVYRVLMIREVCVWQSVVSLRSVESNYLVKVPHAESGYGDIVMKEQDDSRCELKSLVDGSNRRGRRRRTKMAFNSLVRPCQELCGCLVMDLFRILPHQSPRHDAIMRQQTPERNTAQHLSVIIVNYAILESSSSGDFNHWRSRQDLPGDGRPKYLLKR